MRWKVLVAACVVTAVVACGGDDEEAIDAAVSAGVDAASVDATMADASVPDAPVPDASGPDAMPMSGTISISAVDVADADGKVVLGFVFPVGGGADYGNVCLQITGDPGSVSGPVKERAAMSDPCTLGDDVVFEPGTYDVQAGLYTPGMMAPDLCAVTTVAVDGDVTVVLPAFAACE